MDRRCCRRRSIHRHRSLTWHERFQRDHGVVEGDLVALMDDLGELIQQSAQIGIIVRNDLEATFIVSARRQECSDRSTLSRTPKTMRPSKSSDAAAACGVLYRLAFHVTMCN